MGSLRRKTATKPLPDGAELYRRKDDQLARWLDKAGKKRTARLTTGRDGSQRIVVECGTWLAKYRDGAGIIREVSTGCRDKAAARSVLTDLERKAELVRSNVITAAESAVADHATVPVVKHFEAYQSHRVTQELSPARIKGSHSQLLRIATDCGFSKLSDLNSDALTGWLGEQLATGMGARTRNEYRQEMIGFATWCVKTGRLTTNPFGSVPRADEKADRRRNRRALQEQELARLLHVARWRPLAEFGRETIIKEPDEVKKKRDTWKAKVLTYEGLDAAARLGRERLAKNPTFIATLTQRGRERALVYRTLVLTGLRRKELASLTMGSLVLDSPTPYAILDAENEKNRQGSAVCRHPTTCRLGRRTA